ncbi:hypothetical protein H6G76_19330 [Nostoc sp. FACHB-152]|uniref:hypothetical protein n=1 Tax=unclassified Nostoc TaxID=2593658 RepID=UPI00168A2882|nr:MULTISPECIES: hypothetical protein [unclassified Nostoc]MBD2449270.1 hypothetical protein [Nostoc sp. FACHB-152]MBD2470452.1 hypothetical protein [Nostoc sp. FACHB-145]
MPIIQSLLGSQGNPLGQKSYLGYQHNISSQSNTNSLHYRNSNFIKPLVTTKPIFQPSKFLLARKRHPFIDTLITDGDNFGIPEIDSDLPAIELDKSNSIAQANIPDGGTKIKFDISKMSNLLQTQIASNLDNKILTEKSSQITAPKNTAKTKKSSQSKSVHKPKAQKSPKSYNSQRKTKIIDKISNNSDGNLLTTDGLYSEIDNTSTIQPLNLNNSAIAINPTETIISDSEDNLSLLRKLNSDKSSVITDLPSNSTDILSDVAHADKEEILNQNSEPYIDSSNLIEDKILELESYQNSQDINTIDEFSNQPQALDNETQLDNDPFINPGYSKNNEYPNFTQPDALREPNKISPLSISPKTESHLFYSHSNIDEVPEESSNTVLETNQDSSSSSNTNNSSLLETEPLVSEIISPKLENIPNSSNYLDNTQEQPMIYDINYFDNKANSVDEVIALDTKKNIINIPKTQSINTEDIELKSTSPIIDSQTNLFITREEVSTPKPKRVTPDITSTDSSDIQEDNIIQATTIHPEIQSSISSQENLAPLITIQPDTTSPAAQEIEDTNTLELTAVTPVTNSPISPQSEEEYTPELTTIQPDTTSSTAPNIEDIHTKELATITPDISPISPQLEAESTPEFTAIQLDTISNTSPEIENQNTAGLTAITPASTSFISPQSDEESTLELTKIQADATLITSPEIENQNIAELTAITPVATSPLSPPLAEEYTPELTKIQADTTSNTSPNIEDIHPKKLAAITPASTSSISPQSEQNSTPNSNIVNSETADISLKNITEAENLATFSKMIENEQPIQSDASLAINNFELSNFVPNFNTSENTSPPDNVDNTSSIDIEPAPILNNLPAPKGYATGGHVTATSVENHQPVAPSDTVPAMLTPGEFVINAKDAQKNLQILQHINTGGSAEEMISPSFEESYLQTPEARNLLEHTTKVDSFLETPLQRQTAEPDISTEPTPISSPSLGMEIGKQRRSLLNPPQINMVEETTNISDQSSPHYSSPSLIFRKTNSTTNTHTPSQWSSVEELLNGSNDEFTNFNFGGVENNWQNSPSSQFASSSTSTQILTKRLPTPQGFANGGEVIAPDISRDIAPITETIQSPLSSSATENNDDHDDEKIEALAQAIYYRLRQRIELERERQGIYVGRLPW